MEKTMKRIWTMRFLIGKLTALALAFLLVAAAAAQTTIGSFGLQNQRADMTTALSSSDVGQLPQAWHAATDEVVTHAPLVANGRVYFADWGGTVYAADATSGKIIWKHTIEQPKMAWPWHGFAGTGALADNVLIEASVEGNAFGIDPATGKVLWQTRITDQPTAGNLSTLLAHDGLVYIGLQSVDEPLSKKKEGFKPMAQGHVMALDTKTGKQVWDRPLVQPPHNGVPMWSSFALDPEMNALFFGTGNNYTGEPTELSDSVIAVNAKTGDILWARQVTGNDTWTKEQPVGPDYDFGAGAQLFEATIDGQPRKLVGAGQKSGLYWAFDRATGDPVWSTF
jgi:polyvinyl alcohol dehydrogenase (cytochrome)